MCGVVRAISQIHAGIELIALVAIFIVPWLGCGDTTPTSEWTADLRVHRGPFLQRHLLTGSIEAVESAEIKVPRTREHRLQIQWLAPDGSVVAEGDRVLDFDNSSFSAKLDQQRTAVRRSLRTLLQIRAQGEARLREAETTLERARIALAKAEVDASVPESLRSRYEHRNAQLAVVGARADHKKRLADLEATETSVETDNRVNEEQHLKAGRELATAEEALAVLRLEAPRGGIVVVEENPWEDRKFQVGDTVFPGWTIIGIPDLGRLRVRASLSDVDDGHLTPDMIARCTPDIAPDLHLEGRITEITPIAREQRIFSERRGFDVTIELVTDVGDILLVPGMSVRVEIESPGSEELLIPRTALDLLPDPPRALRRNGTWTEVRLGPCAAQHCVLLGGLAEGARLAPIAESTK
jgi:HlyD family secretion protein